MAHIPDSTSIGAVSDTKPAPPTTASATCTDRHANAEHAAMRIRVVAR